MARGPSCTFVPFVVKTQLPGRLTHCQTPRLGTKEKDRPATPNLECVLSEPNEVIAAIHRRTHQESAVVTERAFLEIDTFDRVG